MGGYHFDEETDNRAHRIYISTHSKVAQGKRRSHLKKVHRICRGQIDNSKANKSTIWEEKEERDKDISLLKVKTTDFEEMVH
jgi:hypothetical protein